MMTQKPYLYGKCLKLMPRVLALVKSHALFSWNRLLWEAGFLLIVQDVFGHNGPAGLCFHSGLELAVYTIIKAEKYMVWSKELKESNRFKRATWYNRESYQTYKRVEAKQTSHLGISFTSFEVLENIFKPWVRSFRKSRLTQHYCKNPLDS
jgi:hypothetical protein